MSDPLESLLAVASEAARMAGAALVERQSTVRRVGTKSSDTDPVSDADRASEALLVSHILGARPDDGIVGEEGARRRSESGLQWVLDPLDGTVNYLYGFPGWCVSVACEDGDDGPGGALLGVVHDPVRGETFHATRGAGAWSGDRPLRVNDPVGLDQALVATGFSYGPGQRARQAGVLAAILPRIRDVRRAGSAALDLCWLAAGRVDGYYEDSTGHWDWAAGALIVAEAGGTISPLAGAGDRCGVVAAGPALHPALRAAVSP